MTVTYATGGIVPSGDSKPVYLTRCTYETEWGTKMWSEVLDRLNESVIDFLHEEVDEAH